MSACVLEAFSLARETSLDNLALMRAPSIFSSWISLFKPSLRKARSLFNRRSSSSVSSSQGELDVRAIAAAAELLFPELLPD